MAIKTARQSTTAGADAADRIVAEAATASADQWSDPVQTDRLLTFIGSGVPIWAIQGPGTSSPYERDQATTEGIVIGVFPELDGFWIQEGETDDDPATSAGLFVLTGELETSLQLGDGVRVSGKVRERSGQTLLEIQDVADIEVISSSNFLPAGVELDPPLERAEALEYYEALEGMLVQISEPVVAVGPTSRYGETALVRPEWGVERVLKGDPTGLMRREWDRISYSQFMSKAGIGSRATVSKALKECLQAGYLLRYQMGTERGQPRYLYSLNRDYEVELPTGTETELVVTGTETEAVTSTESVPVTGTETEPTKQKKTNIKQNGVGGVLTEGQKAALDALLALDVEAGTARRLAGTCDPDQVRGWVGYTRKAQGLDNPAGFVVAKLSTGDPAPTYRGDGDREPDDWRRFLSGEYADSLEH